MNIFLITIDDRPGVLTQILEAAAARGVNVAPAYGLSNGSTGLIAVGSNDEPGLSGAIADAGYVATEIELVIVELENRPGTGAEIARRLAAAGVDLRIVVPVGMNGDRIQMGFGASDPSLIKRTIGS